MFVNRLLRACAVRRRLLALVGFALLPVPASAAALLTSHVPLPVERHAVPITGEPSPNEIMTLAVVLPMRNQDELAALLEAIYTPGNPQYRHYLSVGEFTKRFGPSQSDYDSAAHFFTASGLRVTRRFANRYVIQLSASVADIERVFHIGLHYYRHPEENRSFIAPDREPTLDLAVPVQHVAGLDNLVLPQPRVVHAAVRKNCQTQVGGSGPCGWFQGSDMRAAYYGGTTLTGTGQSVGLLEFNHGWDPDSITSYFASVGQTQPGVPINGISLDGSEVNCTDCNDDEQALDIEYAVTMAPGLSQIQVYIAAGGDAGATLILAQMVSDNTSKQLSASWAWSEDFHTDDPLFLEMAAQGQSFLTATGDYPNFRKAGPWPPEDANVTSVGGTSLKTVNPGGPYASESAWSSTAAGWSLDKHILLPSWQQPFINKQNRGSMRLRNVSDISANADYTFWQCWNQPVQKAENIICNGNNAGTSFSSPIWTAFVALANEEAAQHGNPPAGFLNATLYGLSLNVTEYNSIFHDVTVGGNGKFNAVTGYDLVTGLGSPSGQPLIDALAGAQ
jgi:subtilase family serine protease